MKQYEWILFDVDNTLFDFTASETKGLQNVFIKRNIPFSEEYISIYNKGNKELWKAFEEGKTTIDQLKIQRFTDFFNAFGLNFNGAEASKEYLNNLANSKDVIEDSELLLKSLYGKYKLAIVTNGATEVQYKRLAGTKFNRFFEHTIISQEIGVSKPHSKFFETTFNKIGLTDKSKAIIIGDSLGSDIAGGNNFGIDTCWFNPHKKVNESSTQPTFTIHYLMEFLEIV